MSQRTLSKRMHSRCAVCNGSIPLSVSSMCNQCEERADNITSRYKDLVDYWRECRSENKEPTCAFFVTNGSETLCCNNIVIASGKVTFHCSVHAKEHLQPYPKLTTT